MSETARVFFFKKPEPYKKENSPTAVYDGIKCLDFCRSKPQMTRHNRRRGARRLLNQETPNENY